ARADVLGTPSPLTGMHLWVTSTMGLVIAQARADEMLDRNGTPEPLRSYYRRMMADISSNLRPDRPTAPGSVKWDWLERGTDRTHTVNSHILVTGMGWPVRVTL
ncbi:MAG: hypothetical protein LBR78_00180, partial [Holosporales bacterium]|nr:hypothetical protein [Holosporales bacterium]